MIGKTLAHYRIVATLGAGGMGEVWLARDTKLDRDVALKVLPATMASDPVRLERFRREARTVAGLNHPHIVMLHSVEEADGVHFLTMELVEGTTLADGLPPHGLPLAGALEVAIAVADALAAAHARGIVHRDVKPGNVMRTADGRIKVLDFGLARPIDESAADDFATQALPLTREGAIVGTVPYMAPEQLRGQEVDARTDVFALGILLHELATGARPFQGATNADVTSSILTAPAPDLARLRPDLPNELGRILAKCLEKSRTARWQNAAELRDTLRELRRQLDGAEVRPRARWRPAAAWRPLAAGALAAAVIVAAVVLLRSPAEAEPKTIAILPFENLSPDSTDAFFTTGVHEDVMTTLGGLRDLRVISRTTVRGVEREGRTLRDIGERLGARYLVEGSVRRVADEVRVTANLVDASTDETLWAQSYDRQLRDVLAVQSEIAREIAVTLRARLTRAERDKLRSSPTVVVAAYDDYLKARQILNASFVPFEKLKEALALLDRATTGDPDFADGWALACRARSDLAQHLRELDERETDAAAAAAAARTALTRAQELAPGSAAALRAEGYFELTVNDDPVAALRAMDLAVSLSPSDSETLGLESQIYFRLGQLSRAIARMERAYSIDGANPRLIFGLTMLYELGGRYAEMAPFFDRLAQLEPERTHLSVQAKYYRFLADGSLTSFLELEEAVRTVEHTPSCDLRTVQDCEMTVAMANGAFDAYSAAWAGKWDRHYAGHGNWACPMVINDEANHAALELRFGNAARAHTILDRARDATTRPYTEMSLCVFDRAAFEPKLLFIEGDSTAARRAFDEAVPVILNNTAFPRGHVERLVLLQTADMVAPDRVYGLYRQISQAPAPPIRLAGVCANPWTYPNLLKDARFVEEVRADGRFVEFLEHYGVMPAP